MASFIIVTQASPGNHGIHQIMEGGDTAYGGNAITDKVTTGGVGFNPLDTLIKNTILRSNAAPGVGKSYQYIMRKNLTTPVDLTSILTMSDTATFVESDVEATLPAVVNMDTNAGIQAAGNFMNEGSSGSPSLSTGFYAFEYQVPSQLGVSFYMVGNDFTTFSFSGTQTYFPVLGVASPQSSRSKAQIPWPSAGTLQYISIVWKGLSSGTTVQVAVESNSTLGTGTDLMGPFTLGSTSPTSNYQSIVDGTTGAVNLGDFLNWRIVRTAGTGSSINAIFTLGFHV